MQTSSKNLTGVLALKNTIHKIKNVIQSINSRIDQTEERISELKDRQFENACLEEKRRTRIKQAYRNLGTALKLRVY